MAAPERSDITGTPPWLDYSAVFEAKIISNIIMRYINNVYVTDVTIWVINIAQNHNATERRDHLALLFRIREVPGSNVGPETSHPDWSV